MLGLAETGVLGAFLAQDLLLFVLFFDLMLIPFYFLIGAWGGRDGSRRRLKMIVYTLVGSLLMLVGGDRDGDPRRRAAGELSFSLAYLRANVLAKAARTGSSGSSPPRSWSRCRPSSSTVDADAYRAAPIPVSRCFSWGAGEGRRVRLPARGAPDLPGRDDRVPGGRDGDRARRDPVRERDGVHPDERAPRRGVLVAGPARLHHRWGSSRCDPMPPTVRCSRWSTTGSSSRRRS